MRQARLRGAQRLRLSAVAFLLAALSLGGIAGWALAPAADRESEVAVQGAPRHTVPVQEPSFSGTLPDLRTPQPEEAAAAGVEGSREEEAPEEEPAAESAAPESASPPESSSPEAGGGESGSFGAPVGGSSE